MLCLENHYQLAKITPQKICVDKSLVSPPYPGSPETAEHFWGGTLGESEGVYRPPCHSASSTPAWWFKNRPKIKK